MNGKYVVLIFKNTWHDEWAVIDESEKGVAYQDAIEIRDYHIKHKQILPAHLIIVQVSGTTHLLD